MQFSGKITNSILAYLTRNGFDRARLYEMTEVPLEFMNDPTSWISASDVEAFLRGMNQEFSFKDAEVLVRAGHASAELRGWGVLDSVLRMIKKSQDIYAHPQRLISYFISPAPPIVNLKRSEDTVTFDLPIAHNEYPLTVAYLAAALESLPRFWGQDQSQVRWVNTTVQIDWSEKRNEFLPQNSALPTSELLESLVHGVEMAQAQVEARDLEIARLEDENRELKSQLERRRRLVDVRETTSLEHSDRARLQKTLLDIRENALRLTDYLGRCQQVLTISRIAQRQDAQVMTALRKIDWETIRSQYPWLHLQIVEDLNKADLQLNPRQIPMRQDAGGKVYIQDLLDTIVEKLQTADPTTLKIKHKSLINESLYLDVEKVQVALWQVVSTAVRDIEHRGEIELLARQDGRVLEIQVNEHGADPRRGHDYFPLLQADQEVADATLIAAASLMSQQNGRLTITGDRIGARQFTCQWPLLHPQGSEPL